MFQIDKHIIVSTGMRCLINVNPFQVSLTSLVIEKCYPPQQRVPVVSRQNIHGNKFMQLSQLGKNVRNLGIILMPIVFQFIGMISSKFRSLVWYHLNLYDISKNYMEALEPYLYDISKNYMEALEPYLYDISKIHMEYTLIFQLNRHHRHRHAVASHVSLSLQQRRRHGEREHSWKHPGRAWKWGCLTWSQRFPNVNNCNIYL